MRRYLVKWQRLVQSRFALKHLHVILPRLKLANAIRTLKLNHSLSVVTEDHLRFRHDQRLLSRALLALKRYQSRHTIKET